jgi:HSP20 family protein
MHYRRVSYRYTIHRAGLPQFGDPRSERLPFALAEPIWRPPADLYECAGEYVVKVEIPGLSEDEFDLSLYDDVLVVSGNRLCAMPSDEARVYSMEIRYGPFRLEVPVPPAIDPDRVSARYEAGFLLVKLPKSEARR